MNHVRLAIAAGLATALAVAAFAVSAPADASTGGWDACPVNTFCLWSSPDATGPMAYFRNGSNNVSGQGLPTGGRSAWNRTGSTWCLWTTVALPGPADLGVRPPVDPGERRSSFRQPIISLHRPDFTHCLA